jgi:hypothetical protein
MPGRVRDQPGIGRVVGFRQRGRCYETAVNGQLIQVSQEPHLDRLLPRLLLKEAALRIEGRPLLWGRAILHLRGAGQSFIKP